MGGPSAARWPQKFGGHEFESAEQHRSWPLLRALRPPTPPLSCPRVRAHPAARTRGPIPRVLLRRRRPRPLPSFFPICAAPLRWSPRNNLVRLLALRVASFFSSSYSSSPSSSSSCPACVLQGEEPKQTTDHIFKIKNYELIKIHIRHFTLLN